MKAVLHTAYGPPHELQLQEIGTPVPRDNEVLIRIHATTVTTSDCNMRNLTFVPKLFVLSMRMQFGVLTPSNNILGLDLAGQKVIDYTQQDFTESSETYDVILDAVGKSSFSRCKGSLKENGVYLVTVPKAAVLLQTLWTSKVGTKRVKMEGAPARLDNLIFLKEMIEEGELGTVIDRRYPLEHIAEAFRYVEKGHKKGNVVIAVVHNNT